MTNAEAIETLRANYPDACYEQLREAVDAAIEVLKAQGVAGDTISRQAAIRGYQEVCKGIKCGECPFLIKVNTEKGSHLITDCKLEAFLHDLPSAQPEPDWDYSEETKQITLIVPEDVYNSAETIFLSVGYEGTFGIRGMVYSVQPSSSCAHENDQDLQPTCNKLATDTIIRQEAIDAVLSVIPYDDYWKEQIEKAVNKLPSAQPEIVTCKECVYYFDDFFHCNRVTWDNEKDDFCSKGKRKTDGGRD